MTDLPVNDDDGPDNLIEAVGLKRLQKVITALVGAVIAWLTVLIQTGWTWETGLTGLILLATAAGVYRVPNE